VSGEPLLSEGVLFVGGLMSLTLGGVGGVFVREISLT
jgi:hypothetical protein